MRKKTLYLLPRCGTPGRWLYAFGLRDGRVKVGMSGNPRTRMQQHRSVYGAESFVWCHLGPRLPDGLSAFRIERLVLEDLATRCTRIDKSQLFVDASRAMVFQAMRVVAKARLQSTTSKAA